MSGRLENLADVLLLDILKSHFGEGIRPRLALVVFRPFRGDDDRFREVFDVDERFGAQHDRPFDPVFQLPDVSRVCLLYTSDAADDLPCVDLGGRRIIKK